MNRIGIMQGRLSPMRARLQSFPWRDWREEFVRARALGYEAIEWLFDAEDYVRNPLWSREGISEIAARVETTEVAVPSVCAAYFLLHPFVGVSARERGFSVDILKELIWRVSTLDARVILLPILETAAMRSASDKVELLDALRGPLDLAHAHGMEIALESDMPAGEQVALLTEAQHPALGCYYDTGNAAALGRDIGAEIRIVAQFLRGVHIKDRPREDGNVPLGNGDADFERFFPALEAINYRGTLILETTPGDDYEKHARRNLEFVRSLLTRTMA